MPQNPFLRKYPSRLDQIAVPHNIISRLQRAEFELLQVKNAVNVSTHDAADAKSSCGPDGNVVAE